MTKALCLIAAVFTLTAGAQENTKPALLPMEQGPYQPTWESLAQYEVPEWFRDAKFGIWAHWGPQCEPEAGDWYARHMYYPGHWQYEFHVKKYGDPAKFGFKDVIHEWRAEKWDPEYLIKLYKDVGARYFVTLANHHDNFDLWDSDYQPWNSVNMGPEQNIVGRWAEMCDKYGLRFGVSVHASHTWTWMEGAQDFDGKLTAADGKGTWWEGYDPQDLYEQRHTRSVGSENVGTIHSQWEWGNGALQPDKAYLDKFYNRTVDVINKYDPNVVYFDDTALPFCQISDEGLKIAAHSTTRACATTATACRPSSWARNSPNSRSRRCCGMSSAAYPTACRSCRGRHAPVWGSGTTTATCTTATDTNPPRRSYAC